MRSIDRYSNDWFSGGGGVYPIHITRSIWFARTTRAPRVARAAAVIAARAGHRDEREDQGQCQLPRAPHQTPSDPIRHDNTTERVRCRGRSGSSPRASASATAIRCITISSAIGSSSPPTTVAPVAAAASSTPPSTCAERPDHAPRPRDADRPVPILHRRVRLGPRLRRLPQFERRLVRQADAPSHAQEYEVVDRRGLDRQRHLEGTFGVLDRGAQVLVQARAQERQRARREPRLHHRALVGEREPDDLVGGTCDRRSLDAHDRDTSRAPHPLEVAHDLGRGAAAGDRDHGGVRAIERRFGGRERVRLALPERSAERGVGLRDEPRGAAADGRGARTGGGERRAFPRADLGGAAPARGLRGDLARDFAHLTAC